MGMFDNVVVDLPIEGVADPKSVEWQTKDFDMPALDVYRINAAGRLERQRSVWDEKEEVCRALDEWDDLDYHGDLLFYGFEGEDRDGLTRVRARFAHGVLEGFTVTLPAAPTSLTTGSET